MVKDYKRASTVDEAVNLAKEGYVFLAGGTQVNNTPYRKRGEKITKVVALELLDLKHITVQNDTLSIGAMTTLQELADSVDIPESLSDAARYIPTRSVRNIATIGGNVGAGRPDSYIIPTLFALQAVAELADGTSIKVEEYVNASSDKLILQFSIPPGKDTVVSIKESRSQLALPVVSSAVSLSFEEGEISSVIIAAGCIASKTIRLKEIENMLIDGSLTFGPELEDNISRVISPRADFLGSKAYKTYINSVSIADALRACRTEALL